MEILNIGGGELLALILLAIVFFGPEDIVALMRTIGEYTRKVLQMWRQVSQGLNLQEELLGDEDIKETIEEAKASVEELKETLDEVKTEMDASTEEISEDLAVEVPTVVIKDKDLEAQTATQATGLPDTEPSMSATPSEVAPEVPLSEQKSGMAEDAATAAAMTSVLSKSSDAKTLTQAASPALLSQAETLSEEETKPRSLRDIVHSVFSDKKTTAAFESVGKTKLVEPPLSESPVASTTTPKVKRPTPTTAPRSPQSEQPATTNLAWDYESATSFLRAQKTRTLKKKAATTPTAQSSEIAHTPNKTNVVEEKA